MDLSMKNIGKIFVTWFLKIGVIVSLLAVGLQWLYVKLIPETTVSVTFSAIDLNLRDQISSGIGTGFAEKMLGFLRADFSSLPEVLLIIVTGASLIFLGRIALEAIGFPKPKNKVQTIWFGMLYGAILFNIMLIGFKMPALTAIIVTGTYYFILSWIYVFASKKLKFLQQIP